MYIWMKTSDDELSLPLCVADSAKELAMMCGVKEDSIYQMIAHGSKTYCRIKLSKKEYEEL